MKKNNIMKYIGLILLFIIFGVGVHSQSSTTNKEITKTFYEELYLDIKCCIYFNISKNYENYYFGLKIITKDNIISINENDKLILYFSDNKQLTLNSEKYVTGKGEINASYILKQNDIEALTSEGFVKSMIIYSDNVPINVVLKNFNGDKIKDTILFFIYNNLTEKQIKK